MMSAPENIIVHYFNERGLPGERKTLVIDFNNQITVEEVIYNVVIVNLSFNQ